MRRYVGVLLIVAACFVSSGAIAGEVKRREVGNPVIEGMPPIPQRIEERMMQYQNTRSANLQGWDAEGRGIIISTRFAETAQIHYVGGPGGARRQITFFSEPVFNAAIRPDPECPGFVFAKDVGGGEFYQLSYFDMDAGTYRMLTDGSSRNGGASWSHRGDRFIYYSTRRNGWDWDLFVCDIESRESRPVLEAGGSGFPLSGHRMIRGCSSRGTSR